MAIASVSSAGLTNLQLHSSAAALLAPLGKFVSLKKTTHPADPSLDWLLEELENDYPEINKNDCFEEDSNEED